MPKETKKFVVMVGPSTSLARGGMASVVNAYRVGGLFETWPIVYLETHQEINAFGKLLVAASAGIQFLSLLTRNRVAVLHTHVAMRLSFLRKSLFMLAAKAFRVPYILHLHGSEFKIFYEQECGAIKQYYIRWQFEQADCVITLSEEWRQWVLSMAPRASVTLLHNPVNIPFFIDHDDLNRHRIQRILFLGRLGTRKGIADLLRAFAIVVDKAQIQVQLDCGGDGDLSMAHSLIDELGLDKHVNVLGWIEGKDKLRLLEQADVLVLPSYNEGLPMAILEALAYSVPVIATRIGGIPDAITDGEEGYLIEPGDVVKLADLLLRLVSEPTLRQQMRVKARTKSVECFSADKVLGQLGQIYELLGASHV